VYSATSRDGFGQAKPGLAHTRRPFCKRDAGHV